MTRSVELPARVALSDVEMNPRLSHSLNGGRAMAAAKAAVEKATKRVCDSMEKGIEKRFASIGATLETLQTGVARLSQVGSVGSVTSSRAVFPGSVLSFATGVNWNVQRTPGVDQSEWMGQELDKLGN